MHLPTLTLLWSLALTTAALPILSSRVDSYGNYHDYGDYTGPYEHYSPPPLEASLAKLKAYASKLGQRSTSVGGEVDQECGYDGGEGCIARVEKKQISPPWCVDPMLGCGR